MKHTTKRLSRYKLPTYHTTSEDGPDIITIQVKNAPLAHCELVFSAGSADDEKSGTAHFLEHMIYEGPARGVHPELEKLTLKGVTGNATTNTLRTNYFLSGFREDYPGMLEALANMCMYVQPTQLALDAERSVIIQEMRQGELRQQKVNWTLKNLYPDADLLCRSVIGTRESITSITGDDLMKFYAKHYARRRMAIICHGDIKHKDVVRLVHDSKLMSLPVGEKATSESLEFKPCSASFRGKQIHTTSMFAQFPDSKNDDADRWSLVMALNLLTRSHTGPLFKRLRGQDGKIYGVDGSYSAHPFNSFDIELITSKK